MTAEAAGPAVTSSDQTSRAGREVTVRRHRLAHDGEEIYLQVSTPQGVEAPRTLVFGHGAGGCHLNFFQQAASFAPTHRVVLWDQRGFGLSTSRTGRTGPVAAGSDLLAVLDWIGDPAPVHLVGQSMSGWAVVQAALVAPERVASLVLSGSIGGLLADATRASLDAFIAGMEAAAEAPVVAGVSAALGQEFAADQPTLTHLYQMLGVLPSPGVRAVREIRAVEADASAVAALRIPMLFVVGRHDPIFAPADVRAVVDLLPTASLTEVEGAGHSPYYERAEAFDDALRRFLARVDGTGSAP